LEDKSGGHEESTDFDMDFFTRFLIVPKAMDGQAEGNFRVIGTVEVDPVEHVDPGDPCAADQVFGAVRSR
jgi:hypothetical protein